MNNTAARRGLPRLFGTGGGHLQREVWKLSPPILGISRAHWGDEEMGNPDICLEYLRGKDTSEGP